jgi:predicted amidohydrolase
MTMPDGPVRVALFQMTTGIDPAANAAAIVDAVGRAAHGGAAILFTPEMAGLLDRDRKRATPHIVAEEANPVLAACARRRRNGIWVAIGSLACSAAAKP